MFKTFKKQNKTNYVKNIYKLIKTVVVFFPQSEFGRVWSEYVLDLPTRM